MKTLKLFLVALCLAWALPASAFDTGAFGRIPVAHEGRIKPLSVFAQLHFRQFAGDTLSLDQSSQFLATLLFDPAGSESLRFFRVNDPSIVGWMGLPERDPPLYSFAELNAAFLRQSKTLKDLQRTDPDHVVLTLYAKVAAFEQIKDSMTALLPLTFAERKTLYELQHEKDLPSEHQEQLDILKRRGDANVYFLTIPESGSWRTAWQSVSSGKDDALLIEWQNLARAYIGGDEEGFIRQSAKLADDTRARLDLPLIGARLHLEIFYRSLHPDLFSAGFYLIALALLLFSGAPLRLGWTACVAGAAFHGFGLLCRMIILMRPPVSNLHESFLFVGFVAVISALAWHARSRDKTTLVSATLLGGMLQITGLFFAGEDDNLKVLQAVLDTKFWLAVHVVVITSGYAACLLSSAAAHALLIGGVTGHLKKPLTHPLRRHAQGLGIIALCLVTLGTVLGGIWADQSWGRFWGWDPKENGALLIILWITWLLHGRLTQQVSALGLTIGLAALSIVVALSWVGVNLLGVGLHSYGFTSGLGLGLAAFILSETALLTFTFLRLRKEERHGA